MGDLSTHFSLAELTVTDTGLSNEPGPDERANLNRLANYALERARGTLGVALHINSGFRSVAVNSAPSVQGSSTSAHVYGCAADMVPIGLDLLTAYKALKDDPGLPFDQLIYEQKPARRGGYVVWIHLGIAKGGVTPRRQALVFSPNTNGHYLPFDESLVAA